MRTMFEGSGRENKRLTSAGSLTIPAWHHHVHGGYHRSGNAEDNITSDVEIVDGVRNATVGSANVQDLRGPGRNMLPF